MQEPPPRSPYTVRYRRTHIFEASPAEVWRVVERPDLFVRMWPWMKQPNLKAEAIELGSRLEFTIDPPFPYRMQVEARFTKVVSQEAVEADIVGDLEGVASALFAKHPRGTRADVTWTVELKQKRMRTVARVARPVLVQGHNWAVRVALRGFKRQLQRGKT